MPSLKKNIVYQTIYQILNVGLPLITAPFLARKLGAESLGIMSYTTSVANYFVLFAMMGLTNYGTRSIATVKDNKDERRQVFSEIFGMQLLTSFIACVIYIGYMMLFCKDNQLISWIQFIMVFSCFFDVNWFFFGIEAFSITVKRSIIIRVCSVGLMLALIREPSDLWLYALLLIGSTFISQLVLWFYLPKFIDVKLGLIKFKTITKHFKNNVALFIPLLAMSVYHIMDKTMLGLLSDYYQSGYYYNADKVINIPIGLLTGIGTVLLPRMTIIANSNKKEKELSTVFGNALCAIIALSAAMAFGIAAIAKEFTPLFFGGGYDECIILISALAPVLLIKGIAFTARYLYLIPTKKEKILTESVILGAVCNLIMNFIFIPRFGAFGAVIGTLAAELVACMYQYIKISKDLRYHKYILRGGVYVFFGIVMYIVVRMSAEYLQFDVCVKLLLEICLGGCTYVFLCFLYWKVSKNQMALDLINSIVNKRNKNG